MTDAASDDEIAALRVLSAPDARSGAFPPGIREVIRSLIARLDADRADRVLTIALLVEEAGGSVLLRRQTFAAHDARSELVVVDEPESGGKRFTVRRAR